MIVTPSDLVADQLCELFSVDRDRLRIIPPGVDDSYGEPAGEFAWPSSLELDDGRPFVLGLNSAVPRKNGQTTAQVLAEVKRRRPDVCVALIGFDGPNRVFGAAERPNNPDVIDLGSVDDTLLTALLQRATVFVSLSLAEGFGMTPLEAAAAGSAVVSTDVPSVRSYPPPDLAIVDPHDVPAAANAVEEFLDSGPTSVRPIDSALRWDHIGQTFRNLIADIT